MLLNHYRSMHINVYINMTWDCVVDKDIYL